MFSFAVACWRRWRNLSFGPRVSCGAGAPMVVVMTASAVFCTSDVQERQTRDARARSFASRKLNQCVFPSSGIHVFPPDWLDIFAVASDAPLSRAGRGG